MELSHILSLCYALLIVAITVSLIAAIKNFGKITTESYGPELNLLTYVFLLGYYYSSGSNRTVLAAISPNISVFKPIVLISLVLFNLILMLWNFKVSARIANSSNPSLVKFFSYVLGIAGISIFIVLKVFLD